MHAIGLDGSAGIVAEQLLAGMLDALVVASMSLLLLILYFYWQIGSSQYVLTNFYWSF